jgi:PAS domain S-box-containing protein
MRHGQTSGDNLPGSAAHNAGLAIVVTDARLCGDPITYVNAAFERLTLYSDAFALGRSLRFLEGPQTDETGAAQLREQLRSSEEFQVTLTCHRADGTPFRNQVIVSPVHDDAGVLTASFCVMREVDWSSEAAAPDDDNLALLRELQHRVKNHLAMIVGMIRLQAARDVTPDSFRAVSRRVEALALLYEELLRTGEDGGAESERAIDAGAYLSRIASVVSSLQAQGAIRLNVECEEIMLPLNQAARLGLLLSEFLTNALEHAFVGRARGRVEVRFCRVSEGRVRLSVEDDGVGFPEESRWPFSAPSIETQQERARSDGGQLDTTGDRAEPGVGGSIVAALSRSLQADLQVSRLPQGTIVTVDFAPAR